MECVHYLGNERILGAGVLLFKRVETKTTIVAVLRACAKVAYGVWRVVVAAKEYLALERSGHSD